MKFDFIRQTAFCYCLGGQNSDSVNSESSRSDLTESELCPPVPFVTELIEMKQFSR